MANSHFVEFLQTGQDREKFLTSAKKKIAKSNSVERFANAFGEVKLEIPNLSQAVKTYIGILENSQLAQENTALDAKSASQMTQFTNELYALAKQEMLDSSGDLREEIRAAFDIKDYETNKIKYIEGFLKGYCLEVTMQIQSHPEFVKTFPTTDLSQEERLKQKFLFNLYHEKQQQNLNQESSEFFKKNLLEEIDRLKLNIAAAAQGIEEEKKRTTFLTEINSIIASLRSQIERLNTDQPLDFNLVKNNLNDISARIGSFKEQFEGYNLEGILKRINENVVQIPMQPNVNFTKDSIKDYFAPMIQDLKTALAKMSGILRMPGKFATYTNQAVVALETRIGQMAEGRQVQFNDIFDNIQKNIEKAQAEFLTQDQGFMDTLSSAFSPRSLFSPIRKTEDKSITAVKNAMTPLATTAFSCLSAIETGLKAFAPKEVPPARSSSSPSEFKVSGASPSPTSNLRTTPLSTASTESPFEPDSARSDTSEGRDKERRKSGP